MYVAIPVTTKFWHFAGPSSEPYLLFGNRNFIRRSSLMINSTSEVIVNSSQGTFVGIDFDIRSVAQHLYNARFDCFGEHLLLCTCTYKESRIEA